MDSHRLQREISWATSFWRSAKSYPHAKATTAAIPFSHFVYLDYYFLLLLLLFHSFGTRFIISNTTKTAKTYVWYPSHSLSRTIHDTMHNKNCEFFSQWRVIPFILYSYWYTNIKHVRKVTHIHIHSQNEQWTSVSRRHKYAFVLHGRIWL